jgi:hypothetical protein
VAKDSKRIERRVDAGKMAALVVMGNLVSNESDAPQADD